MYLGDCLEVMPTVESVDHVITDPPYEAEAHTLQRRKAAGWRHHKTGMKVQEAPLDFAAMTDGTRRAAGAAFARVTKRWALVFCQVEAAMLWREARLELDHDMSDAQVGAWVEANWQFIRGDQVSVEFLILRFEGSTYTLPYMAQDFRNVEFLKWSFDHSRSSVNQLFPPIRIGSDLEQAKRQVVELVRQVRAFGQR
jgi:hypothetical protein